MDLFFKAQFIIIESLDWKGVFFSLSWNSYLNFQQFQPWVWFSILHQRNSILPESHRWKMREEDDGSTQKFPFLVNLDDNSWTFFWSWTRLKIMYMRLTVVVLLNWRVTIFLSRIQWLLISGNHIFTRYAAQFWKLKCSPWMLWFQFNKQERQVSLIKTTELASMKVSTA